MDLFSLCPGVFLIFLNMILPAHVIVVNTLCSLFLISFVVGRKVAGYIREHGRRDVARVGEYTYFAFLVFVTWALSRGTGQRIDCRHLLPERP
ncbi:hypothetical protein A1O1_05547, partial [Capronia coronata CBS 617.96]